MTDVRDSLRVTMALTATDERESRNAAYHEWRPAPVPTTRRAYVRNLRWWADCSSGARDVCWWSPPAPDPFQNGWQPFGNSSTIWSHLHHEPDWSKAEIGDLFTFGYWSGERHVCMVYDVSDPEDPMVWNFGGPGQPYIGRLSAEIAFHRGMTVTLCKLPIVDPPATPQEKLRLMTGFYAWISWRLGRGPFKHYGKLNKAVRPAVPRVISPVWWTRLARFLAAEKKPNRAVKRPK